MSTSSLWIIRVALAVQLMGVLAVPAAVAATESPRAMWIAEWLRPRAAVDLTSMIRNASDGRTIGVLKLRDGKLSFTEQAGQAGWAIDLSAVKRIVASRDGKTMTIESMRGEIYVMSIMEPNLTLASSKRVVAFIERSMQGSAAVTR